MDIKTIREKQAQLEQAITNLIMTFEEETGLVVEAVSIDRLPLEVGGYYGPLSGVKCKFVSP